MPIIKFERVRTLPEIALDIHMSVSGAMERSHETGESEQSADLAYIRGRLAQWAPSTARSARFDAAVKELCTAALEEAGEDPCK